MSKVKMGEESIKSMKSYTQNGGYFKCLHMCTRGGGCEIGLKIRTYLMDGPKQMLLNIFCALLRPCTEHHRQQGKSRCFLPS